MIQMVIFYEPLFYYILFIINTLSKGMIFFYHELIENRGGISILHHFKERFTAYFVHSTSIFIVWRAFFCAKNHPLLLFNSAQR